MWLFSFLGSNPETVLQFYVYYLHHHVWHFTVIDLPYSIGKRKSFPVFFFFFNILKTSCSPTSNIVFPSDFIQHLLQNLFWQWHCGLLAFLLQAHNLSLHCFCYLLDYDLLYWHYCWASSNLLFFEITFQQNLVSRLGWVPSKTFCPPVLSLLYAFPYLCFWSDHFLFKLATQDFCNSVNKICGFLTWHKIQLQELGPIYFCSSFLEHYFSLIAMFPCSILHSSTLFTILELKSFHFWVLYLMIHPCLDLLNLLLCLNWSCCRYITLSHEAARKI